MTPNNLKERRSKTGLTQEEFCKQLGISQPTLSKWERGDNPIPSWGIKLVKNTKFKQKT